MTKQESDHRHILLMANFLSQDGGCIYIEKQTEYLFGDFRRYDLSKTEGYLGVITNIYLGKIWTKIRRLGFFWRTNAWIERILARHLARSFIEFNNLDSLVRIGCVSEDSLSLSVAENLKKHLPKIKIHFSMLDLPWSYNSTGLYRSRLKARVIDQFIAIVDSADFCTPEMRDVFVRSGFEGSSLITYSAIQVVYGSEENEVRTPAVADCESLNLVLAGSSRAAREIESFCDKLSLLSADLSRQCSVHLLGPYDFDHERIKYLGFKPHGELELLLGDYFLGLVPMSFSESDVDLVTTSFPSKFWLYLMNGIVPVIFAPEYSGVATVARKFELGIIVSDVDDIVPTFYEFELTHVYQEYMQNFRRFASSLRQSFRACRKDLRLELDDMV